jgi:hypothetical protein
MVDHETGVGNNEEQARKPFSFAGALFDFFMVLLITSLTEFLVFAFPRWGFSAAWVVWTPAFQFGIGALLFYLYARMQKGIGRQVSMMWLVVVLGVPIAIDAYLFWFASMHDM